MKKIVFMFLMLIIPLNINADCSYDEQRELYALSEHIDYTYEYSKVVYYFNVTFYNVVPELKISYNGSFVTTNNNRVLVNDIKKGEKVEIYSSNSSSCPNTYIRDLELNLPMYNEFYESEDCQNYPDFKYCTPFLSDEITIDEFNDELSNYVVMEDMENYSSEENKSSFLDWQNLILISISIIILIVIVIFILKIFKLKRL